jgi:hypothetical protein
MTRSDVATWSIYPYTKHAYHEQAGILEQYEGLLRRYAQQLGVPFTPAVAGSRA